MFSVKEFWLGRGVVNSAVKFLFLLAYSLDIV